MPFDRSHPLWELQVVSGPEGDDAGGYVYSRFHHGLGDGIRLVQMLIGTCDPAEGATPEAVGRNAAGEHHHPLERMLHVVEHSVTDTLDYVGHAGQAAASAGRTLMSTTNPLGLAHHVGDALDLVRHPVKLVDALTGIASVDNELSNSWREIGRMLLSDGHDAEAWSGHTGVDKSVAWVEGFPLDGIRAAAKARGATINDVLIAAVSLALTDYLDERGVTEVSDLSWMMPVSLQPIDGELPDRLGNHFVVVMLSIPLGIRDLGALVDELHRRTTRLKHSVEPVVAVRLPAGRRRITAGRRSASHRLLRRQDDRAAEQRPRPAGRTDDGRGAGSVDPRLGAHLGRPAARHLPVQLQRHGQRRRRHRHTDDSGSAPPRRARRATSRSRSLRPPTRAPGTS